SAGSDHSRVGRCTCVCCVCPSLCFFFFSSRRRHTRSKRDWSSDVCSSDLENCFIPVQTVGISAKAGEPEAAEKLVEFLFSQEGQRAGTSAGFPVNETVYDSEEYWAAGDSDGLWGVMISGNNQERTSGV